LYARPYGWAGVSLCLLPVIAQTGAARLLQQIFSAPCMPEGSDFFLFGWFCFSGITVLGVPLYWLMLITTAKGK